MTTSLLICPNCRQSLELDGRVMRCASGHSFDKAREGYVNLLPGKAPSASQGDSAAMVAARRAWLRRGHYGFLAEAIVRAVGPARTVADFGCGEGYYLGKVLDGRPAAAGYGTDISKAAVAAAAREYKQAQFAVADTKVLLPLADSSIEAGMCIFAPRSASEFARVIKPGGRLVVVIPGTEHLAALREQFGLIGIETDKAAKIGAQLEAGFRAESRQELDGAAVLDGAALSELVEMTPNARHLSEEARAALRAAGETRADFRFEILVFIRILKSNEVTQNQAKADEIPA